MKLNQNVTYILNKFNIKDISKVPIELNYDRYYWGSLFNELGFKRGVEIGVKDGLYSEILCKLNPGVEHYCVDPYLQYDDYVDYRDSLDPLEMQKQAKKRLAKYNCKFIKKFSSEAVKEFEDRSFDYVYIDGNHEFSFVAQDIYEWTKKVKIGGIIAGHDFEKQLFRRHCHVMQCVTAYTESIGIYPWFITSEECKKQPNGNGHRSWLWVNG